MTENKIEKTFQLECREDVEFCIDDVKYPREVEYVDTPITVEFAAENNALDKDGLLSDIILKRDGKRVWRKGFSGRIIKPGKEIQKKIEFNFLEIGVTDAGTHEIGLDGVWYIYKKKKKTEWRTVSQTIRIKVKKGLGVVIRDVDIAPEGAIEDTDEERRISFKIENNYDKKIRITKTALLIDDRKIAEKDANTDLRGNQEFQEVYKIVPSEVGIVHKRKYDCKIEVVYECRS